MSELGEDRPEKKGLVEHNRQIDKLQEAIGFSRLALPTKYAQARCKRRWFTLSSALGNSPRSEEL